MKIRVRFLVLSVLLLASLLALDFHTQSVRAEPTIWIVDDDGPADFHTIQEAINAAVDGDSVYVCNGTYYEHITVNKIVTLVGENKYHTVLDGNDTGTIVTLRAHGITVSNFTIRNGSIGIDLSSKSTHSTINNNIITDVYEGIDGWYYCDGNIIRNNVLSAINWGIMLSDDSDNNVIDNNNITSYYDGIWLQSFCDGNTISSNIIVNCQFGRGIYICFNSNNNTVKNNRITNNILGLRLVDSRWNLICHNSFIDNSQHVEVLYSDLANSWDDGYPSGGNYWSDYSGQDSCSGPYQNETGSDGIGDTPIVIRTNNVDNYPLISPWTNIAIANVTPHKTVIAEGSSLFINVTVENQGTSMKSFNASTYINSTLVDTLTDVTLSGQDFTTITFVWNTTSFPKGNYTLIANITQVFGEVNLVDNLFTYGTVCLTILGDVNGDGKVRIDDVLIVVLAFGSDCGHPRYNPNADLNDDCKIRIDDVLTTALNFGLG
ncbi:MAG: right-handed parallel beta-helix repeat-containing protein [Candidatus Bathyarchaeota archaeon]|nr:right-handed parallel beta-helix repeat-containing protein [Candidatus Bathyarchaeota archaeon]